MQGQLFLKLEALSDAELVEGLQRVVGSGRRLLAELLAHLCAVEDRRLHLDAGYPSLFSYCMVRLGFSEDEAYRRINVARLARKAPIVFDWIAEGRLSLSVAALLQPYVLAPNLQQLIGAVAGKSVKAAREILVTFFPRPDVASSIRKLPPPQMPDPGTPLAVRFDEVPQGRASPTTSAVLSSRASAPRSWLEHSPLLNPAPVASPAPSSQSRTEPLAPGRFKIQFTADTALKDKLELARDLLRHAVPSGDLAAIVDRALDLLVTEVKKRRFGLKDERRGASSRKRARSSASAVTAAAKPDADEAANDATPDVHTATIDRATRRAVCERDDFRCTWHGPDGVRCCSRAWLELDHRIPRALGGTTSEKNLRLLCKSHNRRAAELVFGRRHVERVTVERRVRPRARDEPPAPAT
jgi:hypothetical protein